MKIFVPRKSNKMAWTVEDLIEDLERLPMDAKVCLVIEPSIERQNMLLQDEVVGLDFAQTSNRVMLLGRSFR